MDSNKQTEEKQNKMNDWLFLESLDFFTQFLYLYPEGEKIRENYLDELKEYRTDFANDPNRETPPVEGLGADPIMDLALFGMYYINLKDNLPEKYEEIWSGLIKNASSPSPSIIRELESYYNSQELKELRKTYSDITPHEEAIIFAFACLAREDYNNNIKIFNKIAPFYFEHIIGMGPTRFGNCYSWLRDSMALLLDNKDIEDEKINGLIQLMEKYPATGGYRSEELNFWQSYLHSKKFYEAAEQLKKLDVEKSFKPKSIFTHGANYAEMHNFVADIMSGKEISKDEFVKIIPVKL